MAERYYLKIDPDTEWREVSQREYISAERRAGFIPQSGCGPIATHGFGAYMNGIDMQGKIETIEDADA